MDCLVPIIHRVVVTLSISPSRLDFRVYIILHLHWYVRGPSQDRRWAIWCLGSVVGLETEPGQEKVIQLLISQDT